MISFRYHIVTLVSVFLALAVGIALGGGPLQDEVDNSLVTQVQKDHERKQALQADIDQLKTANSLGDDFATGVASRLLAGRLNGHTVSLVALPGADEKILASLTSLVRMADGTVAGTYRVGAPMLDVGHKQLVDELGTQLLADAPDVTVAPDASGYERMGALMARAMGTSGQGSAAVDDTASGIVAGLDAAKLMSVAQDPTARGDLVLVLTDESVEESVQQQSATTIATTLAAAIDDATDGVVVAGPYPAASKGGYVHAVRDDVAAARDVSTVDTVNRVPAQVASVLALAQQADGNTGSYGVNHAADGVLPPLG